MVGWYVTVRRLRGSETSSPATTSIPRSYFTHSPHESHNDHRAAHDITLAAFRNKPILCYGIIKSMIASTFSPRIFTDISTHFQAKVEAFKAHVSQQARINLADLELLDSRYGAMCGFQKAEAFELILQQGSQENHDRVLQINECPFHRFWYTLIGEGATNTDSRGSCISS